MALSVNSGNCTIITVDDKKWSNRSVVFFSTKVIFRKMDGWIDWKDGGDGYSGGQWFVKVAKFDHVVQNHIGNQKKMQWAALFFYNVGGSGIRLFSAELIERKHQLHRQC